MQRIEQSKPEADAGRRHAESAAEITQHPADQGAELVVVDIRHDFNPSLKIKPDRKLHLATNRSIDQFGRSAELYNMTPRVKQLSST